MPDVIAKCTVCGALLDEEDLFCANCGTEAPIQTAGDGSKTSPADSPPADHPPTSQITTDNFTCRGCGASMSYDASAGKLRCPFCGSEQLDKEPDAKEIAPDTVAPFVVTRDQAVATMRDWLGRGFWRPGDLAAQSAIVKMTPVYVPYWVFQADTDTYWTADSSHTPAGARANWYPVGGAHQARYDGLLVGASGALTSNETRALCPFDLSGTVPPDKIDLHNIIFERFTMPRKYARPLARQGLEAAEAEACRPSVPGNCRNLNVNVRITNLASRPVLVPVWIMAYRYRDQVFRFLVNGQTGRPTGQAPVSYQKIGVAIAIAAAALLLVFLWMMTIGGGCRSSDVQQFFSGGSQKSFLVSPPALQTRSDTVTKHGLGFRPEG